MSTTIAPTSAQLLEQATTWAHKHEDPSAHLAADWLAETAHVHLIEDIEEQCARFYGFAWDKKAGKVKHPTLSGYDLDAQVRDLFLDHSVRTYVEEIAEKWHLGEYDDPGYEKP